MKVISNRITRMRKSHEPLLISLLLLNMCSSSQAGVSNDAEIGLALAGIPFDIAAHHYALTNQKKTAAVLHVGTSTISMLNKICCLYNNNTLHDAKTGWEPGRDFVITSALTLRDLQQWYQRLKDCLHVTNNEHAAKLTISHLAYAWNVVLLPCLKGLTACAIAAEQRDHEGNNLCYATTAAHALTKLLDEYATLEKNSPYKKWLSLMIVANLLWLGHESHMILFPDTQSTDEQDETTEIPIDSYPIDDQVDAQKQPGGQTEITDEQFPPVKLGHTTEATSKSVTNEDEKRKEGVPDKQDEKKEEKTGTDTKDSKKPEYDLRLFDIVIHNNPDEVTDLLTQGVNVNTQENHDGWTALHFSVQENYHKVVQVLLNAKANVNLQDRRGNPPLHFAVDNNNIALVNLLLKHNANPIIKNNERHTASYMTCVKAIRQTLKEASKEFGQLIPQADEPKNLLLFEAIKKNNLTAVQSALVQGADIRAQDQDGRVPLHHVARNGNLIIAQLLLAPPYGANVNAQDESGNTPLHIAVIHNNSAMVNVLLDHNANSHIRNLLDKPAAEYAVGSHAEEIKAAIKAREK